MTDKARGSEVAYSNAPLRQKLLRRMTTASLGAMAISYPIVLLRALDLGFAPINTVQSLIVLLMLAIFLARKHLDLRTSAAGMLLATFVWIMTAIGSYGVLAPSHLVIPFITVFTSIAFGRKASLWLFGISIFGVVLIAALYLSGAMSYQVDAHWYVQSWTSWFVLVVTQTLLALWYIFMVAPINEASHHFSERMDAVLQGINDALFIHDKDSGAILQVNQKACAMYGYSSEEALRLGAVDLSSGKPPYDSERAKVLMAKAVHDGPQLFEWQAKDYRGRVFWVEVNMRLVNLDGTQRLLAVVRDISERKQAEKEKSKLEAQLQHAQKMESVGRLAGGVAHDFNNMLGVILGHTELALEQVAHSEPLHSALKEIKIAAERSANLTRQLLAFARKQTIAPKVLDLNETVENVLKMLRQLIGEDITLLWSPGAGLSKVKMDPTQVDQILANLCVNARDAIGSVGKLTIKTANSTFDDDYCAERTEIVPGEYVMLAVSDDGCGMEKATLERLFEPFFTTKGVGKGTGLGLATVYGIVKQNNGCINVASELGKGSTFEIFLPKHEGPKIRPTQLETPTEPIARGHETILVVEDEAALLNMTKRMLMRLGYTVLTANSPSEAIRVAGAYAGVIHLLLTDVVMPEMNGRDLANYLLSSYPSLNRLFMSGYTADVIANHGVLNEEVHFVQKPFSIQDLAARVSEALERG